MSCIISCDSSHDSLKCSSLYVIIRAIARKPRPKALDSAQSTISGFVHFHICVDATVWWCLTQTASKNIEPLILYWIFTKSPNIHDWETPAHCHDYISRTVERIQLKLSVDIHSCYPYHQKKFQTKWLCSWFSAYTSWRRYNAYFGLLCGPISND